MGVYSKSAKTSSVNSRMKTLQVNTQSVHTTEHKTPTVKSWVFYKQTFISLPHSIFVLAQVD